ncbi:acyltransferase family protein [Methylobacterium sp. J-076]|uniref:acyltransferase family protein n=1 Tax=Methylobacterium sp. J-076 TaxID=2836655 RepID=UPI001FB997AA|nr:acyltransferase [Methylobacterium sp. J-076]MCJ2014352.1 acyltransferase [Methylobacterium sp. J-076]
MLVFIQILRAVAAAMVVLHHGRHEVGLLADRGAGAVLPPGTLLPWWAGVDLFFVISGFVIVQASRPLAGVPGGRGRFLAHRIARVVPLYWLTSFAYLALALAAPGLLGEAGALAREPGYLAASFLFWPAARPDGSVQPLYGLGWTLNYEMAFYAVFALGLGFGLRRAVAGLWAGLGGLVALGAVLGLPLPLAFWADPIVLEFALGAGLGLARTAGLRLPAPARLALAGLGFAGLLLAARHLGGGGEVPGFARPLLVGLPALLLVAGAALGPGLGPAGLAACPAPLRALARLGDASYALYLVHPFALRAGREALARAGLAGPLHPWGSLLALTLLSIAAAFAVHRAVERPLTRRLRAWLGPRENRVGGQARPVSTGGEDG